MPQITIAVHTSRDAAEVSVCGVLRFDELVEREPPMPFRGDSVAELRLRPTTAVPAERFDEPWAAYARRRMAAI